MEYIRGRGCNQGYILDGFKKTYIVEMADIKKCSIGYLRTRLLKYKTVEEALDFDISIRRSGIFGAVRKVPKLQEDKLFYKAMKALSLCNSDIRCV